jgi:hypothetical protein
MADADGHDSRGEARVSIVSVLTMPALPLNFIYPAAESMIR